MSGSATPRATRCGWSSTRRWCGATAPRRSASCSTSRTSRAASGPSRPAVRRWPASRPRSPTPRSGWPSSSSTAASVEANPGLCRMLGLDADVVRASNLITLTDPDDTDDLERRLSELRDGRTRSLRIELRLVAADGHTLWTLLSAAVVEDDEGRPAYAVAQAEDITERRSAEHDLVHQTLHDPLTGLGNRLLLKDQLHQALSIVGEVPFAVMFLDLDRFKSVNDTHGHDAGDALLIGVGERLRRIVRGGDTVARLGGDEFAIIAQGISDHRSASAMADKVRRAAGAVPRRTARPQRHRQRGRRDRQHRVRHRRPAPARRRRRHVPRQGRRPRPPRAVQRRDPPPGDRAARDRADAAQRPRRRPPPPAVPADRRPPHRPAHRRRGAPADRGPRPGDAPAPLVPQFGRGQPAHPRHRGVGARPGVRSSAAGTTPARATSAPG